MTRDARQVLTELLVLQAQHGAEPAFRELHALWSAELRRFARVRVEREHAVDEVLSDAWLAIARGLRGLDDPACFPRWAYQIVARRCADWIRQRARARQREREAEEQAETLAPGAGQSAGPAEDMLRLRQAIQDLPAEQRELVHLYYEAGLGVAAIADVLSVPIGTIKSRLFAVREALKQQLQQDHE